MAETRRVFWRPTMSVAYGVRLRPATPRSRLEPQSRKEQHWDANSTPPPHAHSLFPLETLVAFSRWRTIGTRP